MCQRLATGLFWGQPPWSPVILAEAGSWVTCIRVKGSAIRGSSPLWPGTLGIPCIGKMRVQEHFSTDFLKTTVAST